MGFLCYSCCSFCVVCCCAALLHATVVDGEGCCQPVILLAGGERGLALRFPRFLRARPDKALLEATSSEQLAPLHIITTYCVTAAPLSTGEVHSIWSERSCTPSLVTVGADGSAADDEAFVEAALPIVLLGVVEDYGCTLGTVGLSVVAHRRDGEHRVEPRGVLKG